MKKVLLIDNFDSFTYNLVQLIRETELCELKVLPYDQVDDAAIGLADGFVISPGPGVPDDFPNLELFITRFQESKSILGVCMGHEAMGLAFGANLVNLGSVFHGIRKTAINLAPQHPFLKGLPGTFDVGLYHSWAISETGLPETFDILSRSGDGILMAIAHKRYPLVGVQFHPESIMTPLGGILMRNWVNAIPG